jgi:hypothetical protein
MKDKLKVIYDEQITISFPSLKESGKMIEEKWDKEILSHSFSFIPKIGDRIKLFGPVKNKCPHSNEYVSFIENIGLFLPNAYGLIIVEHLDMVYNFIKPGTFIMGIDNMKNLYYEKHCGHLVPVIHKNEKNSYSYLKLPWGMVLEADEVFPAFEWINV